MVAESEQGVLHRKLVLASWFPEIMTCLVGLSSLALSD